MKDDTEYKTRQRRSWDDVAAGWEKWWPVFERYAQSVSDRIIELAEIGPGMSVLDVATGIGEPAITAARLVSDSGSVVAIDLSPEMLSIGRKRAEQLGLENIEFRKMDAEAVDQLDNRFDAILCRWGLFFLPDLKAALVKMRQRLASDGRLVAVVWGKPQKVPALSLPLNVAREVLQRQLPPGPSVFSLSDPAELKLTFEAAGFSHVHTEELTNTAEFESADEFIQFTQEVSAPVRLMLADQTHEKQAEIWNAIACAVAGQFAGLDGRVTMPMTLITVTATCSQK